MGRIEERLAERGIDLPRPFSPPPGVDFKFDLVRVQDSYGRASQPYESTGAASKTLPELVPYGGIPGAKFRPTDIHGHHRFTICKAVVDQDDDHRLLLAVPVGPHSLARGIEVFAHGSLASMSLHETEHCFTISVSL